MIIDAAISIGPGAISMLATELADGTVEIFPDLTMDVICCQFYDWLHNQHRIGPALRIALIHQVKREVRWTTAQTLADLYVITSETEAVPA